MASRAQRICFVSNNVYTALCRVPMPFIGGAELQQAILGRCLKQRGLEVSYVTNAFCNRREDESVDGMRIFKNYAPQDGLPLVRFFHPRLTGLWRALRRADADIYYQRCAGKYTAFCAYFCRHYGRKFVFSGAGETDFHRELLLNSRERVLYRWGLRHADLILVQTEQQKSLLAQNYSLEGSVLPNVYPSRDLTRAEGYVLWVGNLWDVKRPLLCLEVARLCPHVKFVMIGGVGRNPDVYTQIQNHGLPNLNFLGFQPLEETEKYFDGSSLLLNTSLTEGFPNTYLQAWSRGIPTLGTVDPSHLITRNNLGKAVSGEAEIVQCLDSLLKLDTDERRRIQRFFERNFSPEQYVDRFLHLLGAA